MTTESFTATPDYPIAGVGPYPLITPYSAGSIEALVVDSDGTFVSLPQSSFAVSPSNGSSGNVTLTAAAAAAYAGQTLRLLRSTEPVQAWGGETAREEGLEAQLDILAQALQDARLDLSRALKLAPVSSVSLLTLPDPVANAALIGNPAGDGWISGSATTSIIIEASTTFRVPSDYSSVQAGLDAVQGLAKRNGAAIKVLLEEGQEWDAQEVQIRGVQDVIISAEDAVVNTPANFPDDHNLATLNAGASIVWDVLVDMGGRGRNGLNALDSTVAAHFTPTSGIINAGAGGAAPNGSNVLNGGRIFCEWDAATQSGPRFSGAARRNIWNTYTGTMTGKYNDMSGSGFDPSKTETEAGYYNSRGGVTHNDRMNLDGCAMGARNARGISSLRDTTARNIKGHVAWQFEGGVLTASNIDASGSGFYSDWNAFGSVYEENMGAPGSSVIDVAMRANGGTMYTCGNAAIITQFTLGDPFTINNLVTTDGMLDVAAQEAAPLGLDMSSDGQTLMIIGAGSGVRIHKYSLSTAHDITGTVTLAQSSADLSANLTGTPGQVRVSDDGLKLFVLDKGDDRICEFAMSAANDLSTLAFVDAFDLSAIDTDPAGFDIANAGARLVVIGRQNERIYDLDLATPWDISTAADTGLYDELQSLNYGTNPNVGTAAGISFPDRGSLFYVAAVNSGQPAVQKHRTEDYALFYIGSVNANRAQGGGMLNAESATVDDAEHHVAECFTTTGFLNIENAAGTGLKGSVAVCSMGTVGIRNGAFTAAADSRADQMLQSSNSGEIEGLGVLIDAANVVDYIARVSDGGRIYLREATLLNAALNVFNFGDGGGEIFIQSVNINGVVYFPNGATLGDNAVFATRQEAVNAIRFGFNLANGKSFTADGHRYRFNDAAGDPISDMAAVEPVDATPEHYPSLAEALANSAAYPLTLAPKKTYDIAAGVVMPAGAKLTTNGATLNLTATIADGTPAFDIGAGSHVTGDLIATIPAGVEFNRFFRIADSRIDGNISVTAADQVANNNFGHDALFSDLAPASVGIYSGAQDIDKEDLEAESATWYQEDFSFAAGVVIGASPSGVILDGGNAGAALWLGFTGTEIVFRVGDASSATPANGSNLRVAFATACDGASIAGRTGTFYGQVDVSTEVIRLWFYDSTERTLYGLGEAAPSGTWAPAWTNNVDWAFGQARGGSNITGETLTDFTGTAVSLDVFVGQVDLDFQDVTAVSKQALNPDAQNGAVLLTSSGGDTAVGDISVINCDFGVTHRGDDAQNLSIGNITTRNALRAVKLESAASLTHGNVTQTGASPNAILGHVSGQNTLVLSDLGKITGKAVTSEDTGEHGMRVGFATGDQAPDMTYDTIISRRAGQSGLKIADGQGQTKSFTANAILVEDAGYRPNDIGYNPGLNEAALMLSVEQANIGRVVCRPVVMAHCGNHTIDLRGCGEVMIGPAILEAPDGIGIRAIDEDESGTARPLSRLKAPDVSMQNVNGSAIKLDYRNANLGNVTIKSEVDGCAGDWYVDIDVDTDNMAITGAIVIELWVSGAAPAGVISVTDNAAIPDPNLPDFFIVRVHYLDGTPTATYGTAA